MEWREHRLSSGLVLEWRTVDNEERGAIQSRMFQVPTEAEMREVQTFLSSLVPEGATVVGNHSEIGTTGDSDRRVRRHMTRHAEDN